jgi:hypothetical protein
MSDSMWWWGLAIAVLIAVLINFGMTYFLWQESRRGPKRKFLRKLQDSKPITPKHSPPVRAGGADPIGLFIRDADKQFFADFATFADVLNHWLAGDEDEPRRNPWRVQELPDPELRILGPHDAPAYGRRYDIFYNQIKVGDLEIDPHWEYSSAEPKVTVALELDCARWLPFGQIHSLIYWMATLTASRGGPHGEEHRAVVLALHDAALRRLWQIKYDRSIDDRAMGGEIRIQFSGTANLDILVNFGHAPVRADGP